MQRALAACRDDEVKAMVAGLPTVERQGAELLIETITYPLRFTVPEAGRLLFDDVPARAPRLDLPLHREQFDGTLPIR